MCGGLLGGNDKSRAEKQNVVLTWFRPMTWSSGHLGRRKLQRFRVFKIAALGGPKEEGQMRANFYTPHTMTPENTLLVSGVAPANQTKERAKTKSS